MAHKAGSRVRAALVGATALALVAGCAPIVSTHGYAPIEEDVDAIIVGQDTRGSVRRKIGRPGSTGIFTDEGWFYVSTVTEQRTWNAPEIVDRRVVAVLFDQRDVVSAVNRYGVEDGKVFALERSTTPTLGRELTIIEQLIGNIGLVNPGDFTTQ